jgi:hypothetical protein
MISPTEDLDLHHRRWKSAARFLAKKPSADESAILDEFAQDTGDAFKLNCPKCGMGPNPVTFNLAGRTGILRKDRSHVMLCAYGHVWIVESRQYVYTVPAALEHKSMSWWRRTYRRLTRP